jgi:hypothetical protein
MRGIKIALLCLTLLGCEEALFEKEIKDTPTANFDYLWQQCSERYSFFDLKGIDWDEYYRVNRPTVGDKISDDSLFNVLAKMLNTLRDGHVNLNSPFNISRFDISLLGPVNYDWRNIKENYIGADYLITGPFHHDFLANKEVGYIRYNSFSQTITSFDISYLFSRYRSTKGLILDLRSNGGGSITNMYNLLNVLHNKPTLLYTSSIKNGPGQNDFTEPIEIMSEANENGYPRRIVVLTDRQTFSASSFFTLAAKSISNMTVMGDTTGGGLGLPNGGQLPNGWTYRFSITKTLDPQGNNYENGIPPDVVKILTAEDRISGRDTVIEAAVDLILN